MGINLTLAARLISDQLGVPVMLSILEERHEHPIGGDGAIRACVVTNTALSKVTASAAEAMIANALQLAIQQVEDENCVCEACAMRVVRLKAALGIFEEENQRLRRRAI
jgi:hypothetical protein